MKRLMIGLVTALALTCLAQDGQEVELDAETLYRMWFNTVVNDGGNFTERGRQGIVALAGKCGKTEKDVVRALEADARRYRQLAEETPATTNAFGGIITKRDTQRCVNVLNTLAVFRDRDTLPLYEDMITSTEDMIRHVGVYGYFQIAGMIDTLPLIDRLIRIPQWSAHNRSFAYIELKRCIERSTPPPSDIAKVCDFALRRVMEEGEEETILDRILCKHLPGYSTSVQRAEIVERRIRSDCEGIRDYWQPIKDEIAKTPVHERKDFRAKGELLDPERKK